MPNRPKHPKVKPSLARWLRRLPAPVAPETFARCWSVDQQLPRLDFKRRKRS